MEREGERREREGEKERERGREDAACTQSEIREDRLKMTPKPNDSTHCLMLFIYVSLFYLFS